MHAGAEFNMKLASFTIRPINNLLLIVLMKPRHLTQLVMLIGLLN
jgi:hypothetical protein